MLKSFLSFIITTILLCQLSAQITIDAETFPIVGDVLKTEFDNAPDSSLIIITDPGPNQSWDYSSLMSPQTTEIQILNPAEGMAAASFPDASYLVITAAGEAYFKSSSDKIELLGFSGPDPIGLGIDVIINYDDPATQRQVPLSYGESYTDNSKFKFAIDADLIPGLDTLGLPITPDSIRLTIENSLLVEADASGNLKVPNIDFDVLRLRRTTDTQIKIEGFAFGAWLNITDLVVGFLDIPTNSTNINHEYVSNDSKEIVASTTMIDDTIRSVQYIASDYTTNVVNSANTKIRSFTPYPNPAIDKIRLDAKGFEPDTYTLKIYNIVGEVVLKQKIEIGKGTTTLKLNISSLDRGTFICSLINRRKRVVSTTRLVKIGA